MILVNNISLQFGGRYLFKDISFHIGSHDRIGLVGANGAGKSTLLRVLAGEASVEKGEVAKAKFVTVGYLPQEGTYTTGITLYKEVETAFRDTLDVQTRLQEIHQRMREVNHETEEFQDLLELYGELQHRFEDLDAFQVKSKIERVLSGLGFSERDMDRLTDEFSGGWQMRIALAKLLLIQPSLLLLDEPTNHLDLDSLQWLEEYLRSYEGAVMIVSHDRRFLDNMTAKTWELSLGNLTAYVGNYSYYLKSKEERKRLQLAAFKNQQQRIRQTEQFIERFRYKATKARQVQSRIKQLEKIERIEIEDEEGEIHFQFPPVPPSGQMVLQLLALHKSYGPNRIFSGTNLDIERGDRIAFVGVNGAGKSTLSRIIAGIEPLDAGDRRVGYNVVISYFAQDRTEELDPEKDVLQTVDEVATGEIRRHLRNLLGCFLFCGDDVFKKVGVLSGGEKSRLALAKMLLQPCNFIVMDEPTNHLDVRSKEVLQEALRRFEGTYVIVSHDRDFLDPIVNKVIEFRQGNLKTYVGNISDYIYTKQKEQLHQDKMTRLRVDGTPEGRSSVALRVEKPQLTERDRKRIEAEQRQRKYEKMKPIRQQIEKMERSIEAKELVKREIEQLMADPNFYKVGDRVKEITAKYETLETELADEYYRWDELTKELERMIRTG